MGSIFQLNSMNLTFHPRPLKNSIENLSTLPQFLRVMADAYMKPAVDA